MRPAAALLPRWFANVEITRGSTVARVAEGQPPVGLAHRAPHHRTGHRQGRGQQRAHHGVPLDDREPAGHVQPGGSDGHHAAELGPAALRGPHRGAGARASCPPAPRRPRARPPPARPPRSGPAEAARRRRPAGRRCRTPGGPRRARAARREQGSPARRRQVSALSAQPWSSRSGGPSPSSSRARVSYPANRSRCSTRGCTTAQPWSLGEVQGAARRP